MDKRNGDNYSWVRYIKNRVINNNKNFLATLTGPTGSGKSWTALSIGELIDPEFNSERVIFRGTELMNLINSGKLKSGSVIIWDEAGIDLSSRNWQSLTNRMLNYLLQTFRHKNFILIFTTPFHDFLDVASRKLFHADFETVSVNKSKQTCRIKPKLLQYNPDLKKWYKKYLRTVVRGRGKASIQRWDVIKPSDELIKEYEIKKTAFTSSLNKDIKGKLDKLEEKEKEPEEEIKPQLSAMETGIVHYWEEGIFSQKQLADLLNTDQGYISRAIKNMRKKRVKIEDYRKKILFSLEKGRKMEENTPITPLTT